MITKWLFSLRKIDEDNGNESTIVKHTSSSPYGSLGFDVKGRPHRLSKDWIELNFKGRPFQSFYKKNMLLKADGHCISVPDGYSNLSKNYINIDLKDRGKQSKYVQKKNEPSCLFVSLANVLTHM